MLVLLPANFVENTRRSSSYACVFRLINSQNHCAYLDHLIYISSLKRFSAKVKIMPYEKLFPK